MKDEQAITDENEHHKEVYAHFGLAVYMAQVLEHGIVNALVLSDLLPRKYGKVPSREDLAAEVDKYMDDNFKDTLNKLIKSLKKVKTLPPELELHLDDSLKKRNFLIHHYFRERL